MASISKMKKFIPENSFAILTLKNGEKRFGKIVDYDDDDEAVIIEIENEVEYLPCVEILYFKSARNSQEEVHKNNVQPEVVPVEKTEQAEEVSTVDCTAAQNVPVLADTEKKEELQNNETQINDQDIRRIEMMFSGTPKLDMPPIDFKLHKIRDKELLDAISQQKSRYDYAVKVKEYSRINNILISLSVLLKKYPYKSPQWGYINYLIGMFSDVMGKKHSDVKNALSDALDSNFPCLLELACIEIKSQNFKGAIRYLIDKIRVAPGQDYQEDYVRILGQCIMKTEEKVLPVIGEILQNNNLSEFTKDMVWQLIMFLVKEDGDAVNAAKKRDVEMLRKTKIGNNLFPWQESVEEKTYIDEIDEIEEIEESLPVNEEMSNSATSQRRGRISAYYPKKNMGFLIESGSGQTWYFNANVIWDENLLCSLNEANIGHEVIFYGGNTISYGQYPSVKRIHLVSAEETVLGVSKAPLAVRLKGLPKDSSSYAKAKEAEQLDKLEIAEQYYRSEIEAGENTRYFKSAIKDLATLLNRGGRPEEAITLLNTYKSSFSSAEQTSLSQMKVQFFIKAKKYSQAAEILISLANKLQRWDTKRAAYLQQEAYCYYAMAEYDTAITKLEKLKEQYPRVDSIGILLDKIKHTKEHGLDCDGNPLSGDDRNIDTVNDVEIMFESRLSILAEQRLLKCNFDGVDVRSREDDNYTPEDIERVEKLNSKVFGKRPLESSKYLLTLAKLTQKLAMPSEETNRYLFDYFICMAEAAAYDDIITPDEVVYCYAAEALQIAQSNKKNSDKIKKAWSLFLAAYNMTSPKDLISKYTHDTFASECKALFENSRGWQKFTADFSSLSIKFKRSFPVLREQLETFTNINFLDPGDSIQSPIDQILALFSNLKVLNSGQLTTIREKLLSTDLSCFYKLDQKRIRLLIKILDQCNTMLAETVFVQIENIYLQIFDDIRTGIDDILNEPSSLSIEKLFPIFKQIQKLLDDNFEQVCKQEPKLEVINTVDFYPYDKNQIPVKLQINFCTAGAPPISQISISLKDSQHKFEDCFLPDTLRYGSKECEFCFTPTASDLAEKIVSLDLYVTYSTRNNEEIEAGPFSISVRLGDPMTENIENPYLRYASGKPIEENDDSMFFGRDELLARIIKQLSDPYKGRCFVLYGQKRSGKTSVVYKIAKALAPDTVYSYVSAASFNEQSQRTLDLMCAELYRAVNKVLERKYGLCLDFDFSDKSLTSLLKLSMIKDFLQANKLSWVVAIDEFTHIYANAPEDTKKFMHAWKTILEQNMFNAIIIGQDTMPQFKRVYSNDFSVTTDERLSFLSKENTIKMAETPILFEGQSRFKGAALDKIFDLTAGSTYFLQKLCSNVVEYMNERKSPFVTGADIDRIAENMVRGEDKMLEEDFDGIISSGDELNAIFKKDELLPLLTKVATSSLQSGWCQIYELSGIDKYSEMIDDLVLRNTLEKNEQQVRIKAGLLSRWLRINK